MLHKRLFYNTETPSLIIKENEILDCNEKFLNYFSLQKQDVAGKDLNTVLNFIKIPVFRSELEGKRLEEEFLFYSQERNTIIKVSRRVVEIGKKKYMFISFEDLFEDEIIRNLLNFLPGTSLLVIDDRIIFASKAASFKLGWKEEELLGEKLDLLFQDETEKRMFCKTLSEMNKGFFKARLRKKDGIDFACTIYFGKVFRTQDACIFLYIEDMGDRTEIEKLTEEKLALFLEETKEAVYIARGDGTFVYVNQAFLDLFCDTREDIVKMNAKDGYYDMSEARKLKEALKNTDYLKDFEIKLKNKKGEALHCLLTLTVKRSEEGKIMLYQGIIRDITSKKRAEESLIQMAYYDHLTGLPNRRLFIDRLNVGIALAKRVEKGLAIIMMDLDGFKEVNDKYGHKIGDKLLKEVAQRLKTILRQEDTVSRIGGDEFLFLIHRITQKQDVETVCKKIIDALRKPFIIEGLTLSITSSLGISIFPEHGVDADTLITNADIAMYKVKESGKNNYAFYSPVDLTGEK